VRRLLINDIALSEVTDDYLKYLELHQEVPLAETAQFVLVGSTLLLIKSKSLLPILSLTSEEQNSIVDLELRLKIFDKYKKIAQGLVEQFGANVLQGRHTVRRRKPEFSPDASMTLGNLSSAMHDVLVNLPKEKPALSKTVVKKVISLEEMMDRLSERINASMQVSFRQFSAGSAGKLNVIVSFLAMLELVRQGVIRVEQHEKFSDINMHADVVQVPRYG
jgi:segregation and condensation protein A